MKITKKVKLIYFVLVLFCVNCFSQSSLAWNYAHQMLNHFQYPIIPQTIFNILDFGAKINSIELSTNAINLAIKKCSSLGGGVVLVPKGFFTTGAIHLLDNIELRLEEGAELRFSTHPKDYLPLVHTSFEGNELMNYSPLIYAKGKKNVAVTGKGILNGQADSLNWWHWSGKKNGKKYDPSQMSNGTLDKLRDYGEKDIPVTERIFGEGFYLRPSFIEFLSCENILIKDVKIIGAPFWVIHPIKCVNVIIDGVYVDSHGPNNDGCDPEYSKNVWIKNCIFNTGDDCIAIKSGRDAEGRKTAMPSENIFVQNCKMIDGHGGVVMGSEIASGVKNVFVENCEMNSPHLDRAIRLKTNSKRGGTTDGVYVRKIKVGKVKECVLKIDMFYSVYGNQTGNFIPTIKNIFMEDIDVEDGGAYAIMAKGYESSPILNVTFKNVNIKKVNEAFSIENLKNLKLIDTYINGSLMQSPN